MTTYFVFSFLSVILPSFCLVYFFKASRSHTFRTAVLLIYGLQALLAVVLKNTGYGVYKWIAVEIFSVVLTYIILSYLNRDNKLPIEEDRLHFIKVLFLSAFLLLPIYLVFMKCGWNDGASIFFRPPLNQDQDRNTVIINSLIRGGKSVYLPDADYRYPLLWYYWVALYTSFYQGVTSFSAVSGVSVATGAFFLILLSSYFLETTHRKKCSFLMTASLVFLFFSYQDIFHLVFSKFKLGAFMAEGDITNVMEVFYRNASFEGIALCCQQHSAFLLFFIYALFSKNEISRNICISFCFMHSPVLCLMGMPVFLKANIKKTGFLILTVLSASFLYRVLFNYWPYELLNKSTDENLIYPEMAKHWIGTLPFVLLAQYGVLSLFILLCFTRGIKRNIKTVITVEAAYLIIGAVFFNFIFGNSETRRYASFLGLMVAFYYLLKNIDLWLSYWNKIKWVGLALFIFTNWFYIEFYFLRSSSIPNMSYWGDYLKINQLIKSQKLQLPILAADLPEKGYNRPLVMHVTQSFASPQEALVHTKVTAEQLDLFKKMNFQKDTVPYAYRLGYRYILWGPLEEKIWGQRVYQRFINASKPVIQSGSVMLFPMQDILTFGKEKQNHLELGLKLLQDKWIIEAWEVFENIIAKDSQNELAFEGRGKALIQMASYNEAIESFKQALILNSLSVTTEYELARLYLQGKQFSQSIKHYESLIRKKFYQPAVFYNLASAHESNGNKIESIKVLNIGLSKFPKQKELKEYLRALTGEIISEKQENSHSKDYF